MGQRFNPFRAVCAFVAVVACGVSGCYVPLCSHGTWARCLPDEFRTPQRSVAPKLNLANLTVPPPSDYILGPNDSLDVTVPNLYPGAELRPLRVRIMADGRATLPLVGDVSLNGMNLRQAQNAINRAYADGFIDKPRVSVMLAEKDTIDVTVLGEVRLPGVYALPKYENDVAHALARAGGTGEFAGEVVEVHRRTNPSANAGAPETAAWGNVPWIARYQSHVSQYTGSSGIERLPPVDGFRETLPAPTAPWSSFTFQPAKPAPAPGKAPAPIPVEPPVGLPPLVDSPKEVLTIPLRGGCVTLSNGEFPRTQHELSLRDVQLKSGDVIVVPKRRDEVFFVVGPVGRAQVVNFRLQQQDRQLGNAFLIPPDRDVDVVTAVAMAGYIDPIESPHTVTVHRSVPGTTPLLVKVDLIKARYDWRENIYIQPGDIVYLNPDAFWWFRRQFDRVVPDLITIPYGQAMQRWINPRGGN